MSEIQRSTKRNKLSPKLSNGLPMFGWKHCKHCEHIGSPISDRRTLYPRESRRSVLFTKRFHAVACFGGFGGIGKRWPTSRTRAPPHSKGAQSRFASLSSTAAKRLPNLLKTLHHPTARMQLLDSVYLGLLKLDIVRHRMQKAKTNLIRSPSPIPWECSVFCRALAIRDFSGFRPHTFAARGVRPRSLSLVIGSSMAAQQRTLRRSDTSGALSLYPIIRLYPGGRNI